MDDLQFGCLLDYFELSWEGYRKVRKGVKKRLVRHLHERGFRRFDEYLEALHKSEELRRECEALLTVSISRFFRDRYLWKVLEQEIVPQLISKCGEVMRVWSAGCARGEEIYSFKILWDKVSKRSGRMPRLQALATDVSRENLQNAMRADYSVSSLKEMSSEDREAYFTRLSGRGTYRLKEAVRDGVQWLEGDLLTGLPPRQDLHIVFLRNNLLTYHPFDKVERAFMRIRESLADSGCLIVGGGEHFPADRTGLDRDFHHPHIYRPAGNMPVSQSSR